MSLLAKTRSSLYQGKERFGGFRTLYLRMDARCLAALLVIFVTGILLRMGLTSTPSRCTITELTLGYRGPSINYAAVQQEVETVLAGMPNWVENPTGFPEPAPDSPMNVPEFWASVVGYYLAPWSRLRQKVCHHVDATPACSAAEIARYPSPPKQGITRPLLDYACQRLHTQYQSFRAQIINGTLYIEECWPIQNWQLTIANTKMVILEALRIFGPDAIPAVDFTGNQWDNDVVSTKGLNTSAIDEVTMGFKWPPLPIFSPVRQPGKTVDIPFPDFSFMYGPSNEFKTPPWDIRRRMVSQIASRIPWEARSNMAIWSGSVGKPGNQRHELKIVAEENPELLFVNDFDVYIQRAGKVVRKCVVTMPGELTVGRGMGSSTNACRMDFHDLCKFKYLVHIRGGVGEMTYSNRLKDLLLCGSVVLYVDYPWQEFFEPLLQPWVHYVPVPTVQDLPAVIRELQRNEANAQQIGKNGAAFARGMGSRAVSAYVVELFRQYAALQDFVPENLPESVPVRCPRDLYEHYRLPLEDYPLYPCMKETPQPHKY